VDLIRQLKERNESYVQSSKEIIEEYEDFLDKIFIELAKNSASQEMSIDWATIDFHRLNPLLVNVVGIAHYNIGSIVKLPGDSDEVIYIDETNVNNFRQPVRLVLPTEELSGLKLDESLQFVVEYTRLLEYMDSDDIEEFVSDPSFLKRHFTLFGKEPNEELRLNTDEMSTPKPVNVPDKEMHDDFDLSNLDLDEAQIASLKLLGGEGTS
jgi:hypothetical protein